MGGRLLRATLTDPYSNVAAEEAIFSCMKIPAVRVWENQLSVVIGRAQLASAETDLDYCKKNSIPVVRRFTAGGAVYNGPGNLNWSFFVPKGLPAGRVGYVREPASMFEQVASVVLEALSEFAEGLAFERPNRILCGGKKICGMAGYIGQKGLLCHGTLLCGASPEVVERLTRPSEGEIQMKYPRSRYSPVTSVQVGKDDFVAAIVEASRFEACDDELTEEELITTESLLEAKYGLDRWNLGDPFQLDYS